ncbi:MAG: hypothetical protein WB761_03035 [Solirubrobacteraceae bacterium]
MRRGRLAGVLVAFAASAGSFAASASATSTDASVQRSCAALTGVISFDRTGTTISVAADPSTASQGCAAGSTGPGVPKGRGRSRIVSTLHRKFARAGHHTLTFQLNKTGQAMLARLGTEDRAYRKRHPHGFRAPSMAFGVALSYAPAG